MKGNFALGKRETRPAAQRHGNNPAVALRIAFFYECASFSFVIAVGPGVRPLLRRLHGDDGLLLRRDVWRHHIRLALRPLRAQEHDARVPLHAVPPRDRCTLRAPPCRLHWAPLRAGSLHPGPAVRHLLHGHGALLTAVSHSRRLCGRGLLGRRHHTARADRQVCPALAVHSVGG